MTMSMTQRNWRDLIRPRGIQVEAESLTDFYGTHPPVPFAVLGSHVLVGDPRAVLHVYDGATGRESVVAEMELDQAFVDPL